MLVSVVCQYWRLDGHLLDLLIVTRGDDGNCATVPKRSLLLSVITEDPSMSKGSTAMAKVVCKNPTDVQRLCLLEAQVFLLFVWSDAQ